MIIYLKDKEEIEGFREAGRAAAKVLKTLLQSAEKGTTTNDLNEMAITLCKEAGGTPTFLGHEGFPAAICVSVNEELVHGFPDDYLLHKGDILTIDIGVTINGYIGDTAETIVIDSEPNRLVHACRLALQEGILHAQPGKKLSDIAKAISNVSKRSKFNLPLRYGGHGINRNSLHADPFVANRVDEVDDVTLYPGMVLAIEPMLIDGSPTTKVAEDKWTVIASGMAAHCEHTVLITEDGVEVLTKRE